MYCQFYHLTTPPFQLSAEHDFLWEGRNYLKSFEALKYGLDQHRGLSLLTGEPGSGKTTIIRALLDSLDQTVLAALISDSSLSVQEFYALAAHSFSLPGTIADRDTFQNALLSLLAEAELADKQVLLVIDEAQQLSPELIEEIDGLLELKTEDSGRMNICLVGQQNSAQEAGGRIDQAFANHVMVRYLLAPFSQNETADYIRYRLQTAGADRELFTGDALVAAHRYSGGFPGQINIICDLALYSGFIEKSHEITADIIRESAGKMQFPGPEEQTAGDNVSSRVSSDTEHAEESREENADFVSNTNAAGGEPRKSYVMPALAVTAGVILLGGGYTWYSTLSQAVIPAEPTAIVQQATIQNKDTREAPSGRATENFDAVGYSPPVEENFTYEQQAVEQVDVPAVTVPALQVPVRSEIPEEPPVVVHEEQSLKDTLATPQEKIEAGEPPVVESVSPEPVPRETTLFSKNEKHTAPPVASSLEQQSEIIEQSVYPKDSASSLAEVVEVTEVEDVVKLDTLPAADVSPKRVSVTAKEKKQSVAIEIDAVSSVSVNDKQQEATAVLPEESGSVVSVPVSFAESGQVEPSKPSISSENNLPPSVAGTMQTAAPPLPAMKTDTMPITGMDWQEQENKINSSLQTAKILSPSDYEYGCGEVVVPKEPLIPEPQKSVKKKTPAVESSLPPAAMKPKKKAKKKRPTRVATASAPSATIAPAAPAAPAASATPSVPVQSTLKDSVKSQAKHDPQPEDVIDWLLNKKGKNAHR